jgi:hypothetical protein
MMIFGWALFVDFRESNCSGVGMPANVAHATLRKSGCKNYLIDLSN